MLELLKERINKKLRRYEGYEWDYWSEDLFTGYHDLMKAGTEMFFAGLLTKDEKLEYDKFLDSTMNEVAKTLH